MIFWIFWRSWTLHDAGCQMKAVILKPWLLGKILPIKLGNARQPLSRRNTDVRPIMKEVVVWSPMCYWPWVRERGVHTNRWFQFFCWLPKSNKLPNNTEGGKKSLTISIATPNLNSILETLIAYFSGVRPMTIWNLLFGWLKHSDFKFLVLSKLVPLVWALSASNLFSWLTSGTLCSVSRVIYILLGKKKKKIRVETQSLGSPVTCWNMPDALDFSHSLCFPWRRWARYCWFATRTFCLLETCREL